MQDGALYDTLKTDGGLGFNLTAAWHDGGMVIDETQQVFAEFIHIHPTGTQYICTTGVIG